MTSLDPNNGKIGLRTATGADLVRILELNDAEVQNTSPLDRPQLEQLLDMASYSRVATVEDTAGEKVAAFIIALREGRPYTSDNYRWFAARYPRFLYIDRIVVDADCAGRGIGRALYRDLFRCARDQGVHIVACEYNLEPPNPASAAFHNRLGFREQGRQRVAGGAKLVSLQVTEL
ncbi:GNAT family N-acetyltransferase [Microbulbifer magnicolonia]|uniref:GNAT family N-acetyltransferase n=1 Tax=Microbulbifer magnicolonia TaxID=3109744 RepID=UPI002B4099B9|nr:GNAT family N-acetyltransferase [Microbulbifer sp. GG15]